MSRASPSGSRKGPDNELLTARPGDHPVTVLLFFFGGILCVPYLFTSLGPVAMVLFALAWTLLFVAARQLPWRPARLTARACSAALYLYSICTVGLIVIVLGWSLPVTAIAAIVAVFVVAAATGGRALRRVRMPAVVPIGLLTTATLLGWWREGAQVRCDDFLRVQRQTGVSVVLPSLDQLPMCRPGTTLPLRRYPRQIWEAPDRKSIVFTTQMEPFPGETKSRFDGSVCSARLPPDKQLYCIGEGKGDGIVEVAAHGQLVAFSANGLEVPGRDAPVSALYAFNVDDLFAKPIVIGLERPGGGGFYEPSLDLIYVVGHDGEHVTPVRGADLEVSAPVPVDPILTDYGHYDETRHDGILCGAAGPISALRNGGRSYLATAFRGVPFGLRDIAPSSLLGWIAFSFGCDWDPKARRSFIAIPNLAAIVDVDYDTGRVLSLARTRVGLRFIRFDPVHRRIYSGDFLRGVVVELDADSKQEMRHWFVGRFARDIRIARDGTSLLVATSLGIVRIIL